MMVKICGITNREDALAAARGGASALGFNFYSGSPRFVSIEVAQEIVEILNGNTLKVGVFVNESPVHILDVAAAVPLDVVQLHGEPAEPPQGVRVWRGVRVSEDFDHRALNGRPEEAFLLDAPATGLWGGTGSSFDWSLARGAGRRIIIAGGLDDTNVRQAIEAARPWGVDACSRLESSPGRKDHRKLARFLEAALA